MVCRPNHGSVRIPAVTLLGGDCRTIQDTHTSLAIFASGDATYADFVIVDGADYAGNVRRVALGRNMIGVG